MLWPSKAARAASHASPTVEEISVEGLVSMPKDGLLRILGLEVGREIDETSLRDGIRRAYAKGIFDLISIERDESRPERITVKVSEKIFISRLRIRGNVSKSDEFIEKLLGVRVGDAYRPENMQPMRESVLRGLARSGFPEASVEIQAVPDFTPMRVTLSVRISEGEPLRIKKIIAVGRPIDEVYAVVSLREGSVFDAAIVEREAGRLNDYYHGRGFLAERVVHYSFADGELTLSIGTGKRLSVTIEGNENISDKRIRDVLPEFYVSPLEERIAEAAPRVLELYRAEGFAGAQVAPLIERTGDEIRLNLFIHEGPRARVRTLALHGNTLPEERLKKIVSTRAGSPYNGEALDEDVSMLREFYMALGYKDAQVSVYDVRIEGDEAHVEIGVKEGARYVYGRIDVVDSAGAELKEYEPSLTIKLGDSYNEVDIADERQSLSAACRSRGYPACTVGVERLFEGSEVSLAFSVVEGAAETFGETVVAGNLSTHDEVVLREITFKPGDPFDASLLVRLRQSLYKLGIFSSVDVTTVERRPRVRDVVIEVREGAPISVEIALGYGEYERQRGYVDIRHNNLFGMNRQGSLRLEASTLETRYIAGLREPRLLGWRIPASVYAYHQDSTKKNIDTGEVLYRVEKDTVSAGIERDLTDRVKTAFTYEFSVVKTSDVAPDVELSKEDVGTLDISSVTPYVSYDSRDNPFDPGSGVFTGASVKCATEVLFSETNFVKATAFASGYQGLTQRIVLAVSVRGGVAYGFMETEELPLVERFFLGGRNTIRGYEQDELGPKSEDGTPQGGDAFVAVNLELRTRITANWRVVGFVDAGNVWNEPGDVALDELKYTAGGGLQYNTPVGPIRVDYGHKLDREPGESSGEFHFSLGHAF